MLGFGHPEDPRRHPRSPLARAFGALGVHPPGPQHRLPLLLFSAFLVSLALASVRHALLHSGAYDLGIFDQAVFLISRWQRPLSSFVGMHILGDHGAWILYVLAPLYWIKADVHWLFALQAGALVMGAWAVHQLANSSGVATSSFLRSAISPPT